MATNLPPRLRSDLTIREQRTGGVTYFVVKEPQTGAFFRVREVEGFVLRQFDGETPLDVIRSRVQERFGAALTPEALQGFAENLDRSGLLESSTPAVSARHTRPGRLAGNLLYLRYRLVDPSKVFEWLAPWIGFFFTPVFFAFASFTILVAAGVAVSNSSGMILDVVRSLSPQVVPLFFLLNCLTVTLHEFAHGLTCRRFGGEVRDMGFLLIYFQPAFYCNVSDAWLFPQKSKRLWVGFAGPFFELFLWALAVLIWRITEADSLLHLGALIVATGSGVKTLFNFNPFIKLDGYYLLSDYLEIPNLRKRAFRYTGAMIRRLAGLSYQSPEGLTARERRIFVAYGLTASLSSLALIAYIMFSAFSFVLGGGLQAIPATVIATLMFHRLFRWSGRLFGRNSRATPSDDEEGADGFASPSTTAVAKVNSSTRVSSSRPSPWPKRGRRLVWATCLAGVLFLLARKETELRVFGPFRALPAATTQVRASVEGIVEQVYVDEGDRVVSGDRIARLSDRDLRASLEKNAAELREGQAKLRMQEAGPAKSELDVAQASIRSAEKIAEYAASRYERTKMLIAEGVLAKNKLEEVREMVVKSSGDVEEAQARYGAVLHSVRPEQIEATRAQIERLQAERAHLESQMELLDIRTPVGGIVGTPSQTLRELRRQAIKKGDEIIKVHDGKAMQAEISVSERDIAEVAVGQPVELMSRAHPGVSLRGKVTQISVAATATTDADPPLLALGAQAQKAGVLLVRTQLEGSAALLRPDMTGQARIACGRRSWAGLIGWRVARILNTEFWSWL